MKALITGGAGVVGKALCRELQSHGVCVRVLALPSDTLASSRIPSGVEICYGDVTDYNSIRSAFDGVDVVFHLAAILLSTKPSEFDRINAKGTCNVISACQDAGVHRLLYVSSISVTYPILTPYGQSKLAGEIAVRESDLDWTIVRPTLVIGDGGGVEFNMFVKYVTHSPICLLPGGGYALKSPVRSVDLVNGIALAGLNDVAIGKTYALSGPEIMSMAQMAKYILKSHKKKRRIVSVPWNICERLATLKNWIGGGCVSAEQALAGFLYDAVPSIENAKKDLGYHPKSPFSC